MISFLLGIVVILVTFYIALIYASTAIGLLGFAEGVLLVLAFVFLLFRRNKISAAIQIPIAVADPGKRVSVFLTTENKSRIPCMKIRYYIRYGNTFVGRLHGKWLSGEPVYYGKETYEKSVIPGNVGNYLFFLEKIRIYDMTGLFFLTRKVKKSASVQVLPQLDNIQVRVTERVRNFYGDADVYDDFHPGEDSSQIFDVREYRAGDKMQRIHWKLSAKSDELLVREDSQPLACAVVFLLNYRRMPHRNQHLQVKRAEQFITIAADIVFSLMDAGCPHFVAWYSSSRQDVVRLRVDDEESMYQFLTFFLEDCTADAPISLKQMYEEKYRYDRPVYQIMLGENFVLTQNGQEIGRFGTKGWKDTLRQLEIVV